MKSARPAPKKTKRRPKKSKTLSPDIRLRDHVVVTYGKKEVRGQVVYIGEAFDLTPSPGGTMRSGGRAVPDKGWANLASRGKYIKTPFEQGGLYTVCRGVIVRGMSENKTRYWAPWPSQVRKEEI